VLLILANSSLLLSLILGSLAADLNIDIQLYHHGLELSQVQKMEELSGTRAWLICFNVNCSTATLLESLVAFATTSEWDPFDSVLDLILMLQCRFIRDSADRYTKSDNNHFYNAHLCAYAALFRTVTGPTSKCSHARMVVYSPRSVWQLAFLRCC